MENVSPLAEAPSLSITINDLSQYDTIITRINDINLDLKALTGGKRIIEFSVQRGTDNPIKYTTVPNKLEFEFAYLQEGLNTIILRLIIGSGTYSIADQLNSEGYGTEFTFYIYKVPAHASETASISESIEDGRLKLKWTRYPYPDFQAYIVNGVKITNQNTVSLIDSTFIEQRRHVNQIEIMASDRIVSREIKETSFKIPKLTVVPKDNHVLISWEKTKFYNSFNKYVIFIPNFPIWGSNYKIFETNDINATSINSITCPFGYKFNLDIQYLADNQNLGKDPYAQLEVPDIEIGELSPTIDFNTIMMNPQNNDIIIQNSTDRTISLLDEDQNTLINTTKFEFNGEIIHSQNGTYWGVASQNDLRSFNPVTFESKLLFNFEYLRTELGDHYFLESTVIDGSGSFYLSFVLYENYNYQYDKTKLFKYNTNTNTVSELTQSNSDQSILPISQVSEDGSFAICKIKPYEHLNPGIVYSIHDNLMEKASDNEVLDFMPMKKQIISASFINNINGIGITIYNLPEFSIASTYQFESKFLDSFSPLYDFALIYDADFTTNGSYQIIDIKTGKVLKYIYGYPRYIFTGKYVYGNINYQYNRRMKLNY